MERLRRSLLLRLAFSLVLLLAGACATRPLPGVTAAPAAPPAATADTPAAALSAPIPADPAIRMGTLPNGLRYYVRHHEKPEGRLELRLIVDAGSLQEDDDQQGFAHFVEHMAFNGTEHFAKQELVDYIESIGMRFGADINASTSFDETIYELTVPTDDEEILGRAFQILEDWAHGVSFETEEIDKERGVVLEEWRLGLGAAARIRDRQFPVLFRDSRYAERLPIGKPETLKNGSADALRRFYRDWYRPDLMAVVAVGDADVDAIEATIREHFAPIPAAASPRPRETYPVPGHRETLWSILTDPELTSTTLSIDYKLPKQGEGTYGDYRRSLVEAIYNGMLNQRLAEIAQRPDPPFLFAGSSKGDYVRSLAVFSQFAAVPEGGVLRGLDALLTEVERVDRFGFQQSELDRIKTDILRNYEQVYRERDKIPSASLAAEYGRNFLHGESIPGLAKELELVQRFLPTIELAEVNRQAREWITEENRVILVTGPEKEGATLPSEDEMLAVFHAVAGRELEPWTDAVLDQPLLAEGPEPGAVVEETTIDELGVTEWRLANGVRVLLKPTDFRNDQVLLTGSSPGGHSLVSDDDFLSARFATTIVDESGLGAFPKIELGKALTGKVAGASTYLGELEEGVSGSASPQDLETMFQLVYLEFTAPRFDEDAYKSLMTKLSTMIENRLSRPETVFYDKLTEVLSQDHPRRQPLTEESLAAVDPQRALAIYRDRFADASDFTFVLVGNFEPAAIRPLVETYLGGLPATGRKETWRDIGLRRPEGVERFEVHKGLDPKSQVQLVFTADVPWSREEQQRISALAQVLTIRLREVLREDLGATYGVGVSGSLQDRPRPQSSVAISFACAPEEAEHLVATVFDEIESFETQGLDPSYLDKVKETARRQREVDVRKNGWWLSQLAAYASRDLDLRGILDEPSLVEDLTLESLQETARRVIDRERYVLGIHYPEDSESERKDPP